MQSNLDIVRVNTAQEVAKVVHLWSTSDLKRGYECDQDLIQRSDWR